MEKILAGSGLAYFWPVGPGLASALISGTWPCDVTPVGKKPAGNLFRPLVPVPNWREVKMYMGWLKKAPEHDLPEAPALSSAAIPGSAAVPVHGPPRGYLHPWSGSHHVDVLEIAKDVRSLRRIGDVHTNCNRLGRGRPDSSPDAAPEPEQGPKLMPSR